MRTRLGLIGADPPLSSDSPFCTHIGLALAIEAVGGKVDGAFEMIGIAKGLMGEEVSLQVAPGVFDIVEMSTQLRFQNPMRAADAVAGR